MNELDLFAAAIAVADAAERAALLDRECKDRPELRARMEALLGAAAASHSPLDVPIAVPERTGEFTPEPPGADGTSTGYPSPGEQAGAVIAGKYTLVEVIGEGGMGRVWRAKQTEPLKRFVAVKLIKVGMDSKQVLARFDAERQALALMDHPNIAKVLDGGLHDHRPFFVMELVKGVPITDYCDGNKLTPQERLELFVPVCQAIQHAHQKGIIHRDIKPSNVLVAPYDDKPVVKVIDFGVAKATGGTLTEATIDTGFGGVVGTPQYMSPEQATFNNLDIDTRSDVYALGVLLYELLAGSPPFSGAELKKKGFLEILRVVREEEPPRPSTKLSTADALPSLSANRGVEPKKLTGMLRNELDWIVMKALEKDRTRRYETANGFAADVQRYLAGEPVVAHPPSAGYRLKKFVRRNRGQVVAASLVLIALLAGVVGTTFGMIRAERARADESAQRAIADAQREKAVKAADRTREVLDAMVSEATGDSLSTQKQISEEQKKFLQSVLGYYREFAGENTDDELSRSRHANAAFRVGSIEGRLGRKEQSAAAFRLARDSYASLAADFPAVPAYRQSLARSHGNLAIELIELGRQAEAVEQLRQVQSIFGRLVADFPAVPEYPKELAMVHGNLGTLLSGFGKRSEAEEQYRQALSIEEKLADEFPAVPEYRYQLATNQHGLGLLLAGLGKSTEAEEQYRRSLAIRERLAAEFHVVPDYRHKLGHSHHNLGNLLKSLGKWPAAEEQYGHSLSIFGKLAADFPAVPAYRQDLAKSHQSRGNLLASLNKGPEAEEQYRKAIAINERLAAENPAVPEYSHNLASNHTSLGNLISKLRKGPEAEEQYRKALTINERLVAENPAVPAYRQDLAQVHNSLGFTLRSLGKRPEAKEQNRKALSIREKLAADFPAVPAYRVDLGGSYCNYGTLLIFESGPADSLEWLDKAIQCLKSVHEQEPRDVQAKEFLRNSHANRARAYDRLQKFGEAVKDWDRAIELSAPMEQPLYRAQGISSRLQAGSVPEAVAEVAELSKRSEWKAPQWYDFACVYAVAGGKIVDKKQEYADRAMELLHQAVKAGFKDAAHMKKDTDLDSLRDREDFKKLIAGLEKKFSPKQEVSAPQEPKK